MNFHATAAALVLLLYTANLHAYLSMSLMQLYMGVQTALM